MYNVVYFLSEKLHKYFFFKVKPEHKPAKIEDTEVLMRRKIHSVFL